MSNVSLDLLKLNILKQFYVEKKSKCQIADDLRCSRNTVMKYVKEFGPESQLVQALMIQERPIAPIKNDSESLSKLQISIGRALEGGPQKLDYPAMIQMSKDHVEYFGITSPVDFLKMEIAFHNYIKYREFANRISFLNDSLLDVSWLKSSDKMAKIVCKLIDSEQKHLKIFQDIIKELEIKYHKRSPDYGRIQNLNIQSNEINFPSNPIEKPFVDVSDD